MRKIFFPVLIIFTVTLVGLDSSIADWLPTEPVPLEKVKLEPAPIFPLEKAEIVSLKEEHELLRNVIYYKQPLELRSVGKVKAQYDTPETSLIAFVSAIKHADYEFFLDSWDRESKKRHKEKEKRVKEWMVKSWKESFSSASFFLLKRIDVECVSLIEFVARSPNRPDYKPVKTLIKNDGKWESTNVILEGVEYEYLASGKEENMVELDSRVPRRIHKMAQDACIGKEAPPKPIFPIEKIEEKVLTEYRITDRSVVHYKQKLELEIVQKGNAHYTTPENALISHLSALKAADYDWFIDSLDKASRNSFEEKHSNKENIKRLKKEWKKKFSGATFILLRRLDRENKFLPEISDVLLEFSVENSGGDRYRKIVILRKENGKWKATNMARKGVEVHYLTTDEKIMRISAENNL